MPPGVIFLISTIIPVTFFALIFGIVYIRNKENMALIERGLNPRQRASDYRPRPFVNLKYGLLLIGSGSGLLLAYILDSVWLGHRVVVTNGGINSTDSDNPAIYFALIAIGGGIGLVISYAIEKKEWLDKRP